MPGAQIPERPRLAPGVRMFECEQGLVVRSSRVGLVVDPAAHSLMKLIVVRLDGRRATEICLELGILPVLGVLGQLAKEELLDETVTGASVPSPLTKLRLDGHLLAVVGDERLARPVADGLEELGAHVRRSQLESAARGEVVVSVHLGPDCAALEALNGESMRDGFAWLPVFALADDLVVGPFVRPHRSACFRCFELRSLGISRAIAVERSFLAHLRAGEWQAEAKLVEPYIPWLAATALASIAAALVPEADPASVSFTRIPTGSTTVHFVERHSRCSVCGPEMPAPAEATVVWDEAPLALDLLRARIAPLCDDRLGLLAPDVDPAKSSGAEGLPAVALIRFAVAHPERAQQQPVTYARGCAASFEDARVLAAVEGLERYCGSAPSHAPIVASYNELRDRAIDPTTLTLFSAAQYGKPGFPFRPFDPARPLRWMTGSSLTANEPRLVPMAAVYYDDEEGDAGLLAETSSGIAAHSARGPALLNGLCELLERDAFMIHWLGRLSPPLVELGHSEDPEVHRLLAFARARGWEPHVAQLTTDLGVPVYLALGVRDDDLGAALLVGAGASLDAGVALRRALHELHAFVVDQPPRWTPPPLLHPDQVKSVVDHAHFYARAERLALAQFLWSSPARVAPPPRACPIAVGALARATRLLASHGLELIGVDVTSPDVARHGVHVVRAVVPGLQPLAFGASSARLGGARLYEAPVRMGLRAVPVHEAELNGDPHCFP